MTTPSLSVSLKKTCDTVSKESTHTHPASPVTSGHLYYLVIVIFLEKFVHRKSCIIY